MGLGHARKKSDSCPGFRVTSVNPKWSCSLGPVCPKGAESGSSVSRGVTNESVGGGTSSYVTVSSRGIPPF